MVADEQTHTLPADREALERFARFLGFADRDAFAEALLGHLRNVQRHYARLFEDASRRRGDAAGAVVFRRRPTTARRSTGWRAMGFRQPLEVSATVRAGLPARYRSLRSEFARAQLAELVPVLLDQSGALGKSAMRRSLPSTVSSAACSGGGRLFSLLRQNPDLVALVALMLGTAPRLADILARHPEVMDALIEPTLLRRAAGRGRACSASSTRSLGRRSSYEDMLDRIAAVRRRSTCS